MTFFLILKVNYIPLFLEQCDSDSKQWQCELMFDNFPPNQGSSPFFYLKTMFAWFLGLKTLKKSSTVLSGHAITQYQTAWF